MNGSNKKNDMFQWKKNRAVTIYISSNDYIFFVLKLDVLIAIFFGFFTIVFNINGIKQNKDDIGILWMERKIFTDDVQALKDYKSNYFFIKFPQWLRPLLVHNNLVWPVRMAEQTKFYKYVDEYKLFLDRISKIFFNIITMVEFITSVKIVVVLTANMDYYQDYPWINAIHKKKGKFIVLEKESIFFQGKIPLKIIYQIDIINMDLNTRAIMFFFTMKWQKEFILIQDQ